MQTKILKAVCENKFKAARIKMTASIHSYANESFLLQYRSPMTEIAKSYTSGFSVEERERERASRESQYDKLSTAVRTRQV